MFNQVTIMGRLAFDPKCTDTKSGKRMCAMTIPTDTGFGDNKKTTWFNVVCFGKLAENCERYLHKGDGVLCVGEVSLNEYESKGEKKARIEVLTGNIKFLPKSSNSNEQSQGQPIQPMSEDNPFYNPGPVSDFDGIPF